MLLTRGHRRTRFRALRSRMPKCWSLEIARPIVIEQYHTSNLLRSDQVFIVSVAHRTNVIGLFRNLQQPRDPNTNCQRTGRHDKPSWLDSQQSFSNLVSPDLHSEGTRRLCERAEQVVRPFPTPAKLIDSLAFGTRHVKDPHVRSWFLSAIHMKEGRLHQYFSSQDCRLLDQIGGASGICDWTTSRILQQPCEYDHLPEDTLRSLRFLGSRHGDRDFNYDPHVLS